MEDTKPSIADELKKLHELLESGIISEEDFERGKKKLIMGVSAPVNDDSGRSQPSDVEVLNETSPKVSESEKNEQIGQTIAGLFSLAIVVIALVQVFDITMPWGIGRSDIVGTYECSRSTMTFRSSGSGYVGVGGFGGPVTWEFRGGSIYSEGRSGPVSRLPVGKEGGRIYLEFAGGRCWKR